MFKGANKIKVKAICVIQHGADIFVSKAYDSVKEDFYYRPIGGTVEFGEYTKETIVREIFEELNTEIINIEIIKIIENIFSCDGIDGHEIMFIYSGDFRDHSFYENKKYVLIEDNGDEFEAEWINCNKFLNKELRLVPEGLQEYFSEKCKKEF